MPDPHALAPGTFAAGGSDDPQEDRVRAAALQPAGASEQAQVSLRFGDRAGLRMDARMTPAGLLAIGAMVSGILLSTAVLVGTALRAGKAPR